MKKYLYVTIIISFLTIILISCGLKYSEEKEINDTKEMANILLPDKFLKAKISSEEDIDFYRVGLKKKISEKNLSTKVLILKRDNFNIDIKIYLDDRVLKEIVSTEKEVYVTNIGIKQNDIINKNFYISVSGKLTDKEKNYPLLYEIKIEIKKREKNQEVEPNDQPVFATDISDENPVKGYFDLNNNIDYDWYKFRVKGEGEKINVVLSGVPDIDSEISIYDDLGYQIRKGDSFGVNESEILSNIYLIPGLYFVRVNPLHKEEGNPKIPYILKIEKELNEKLESEPNDVYPKSNKLEFSDIIKGVFNPVGDVDWFRFNIYDINYQIVTVKFEPTAYVDPIIELYNSSLKKIISVDDRGIDEGEIIKNIGVDAGVYYVKLIDKNQKKDLPQYTYTLNITKSNWKKDEELEINNSFDRANEFELGGFKKGYITPKGDVDFYSIYLSNSEKIKLEISPCILIDLKVEVFNSERVLIKTFNSKGIEEGESGELYLENGLYFIKVSSVNNEENSRDNYILKIYQTN